MRVLQVSYLLILTSCRSLDTHTASSTTVESGTARPRVGAILDRLERNLRDLFKQSEVSAEFNSQQDSLEAKYRTRSYKVHVLVSRVDWSDVPHDVEGPDKDGFSLSLHLHGSRYDGPLIIPQEGLGEVGQKEAYWYSYLDELPVAGEEKYIWVHLAYGSDTEKSLVGKIKALVKAGVARS